MIIGKESWGKHLRVFITAAHFFKCIEKVFINFRIVETKLRNVRDILGVISYDGNYVQKQLVEYLRVHILRDE